MDEIMTNLTMIEKKVRLLYWLTAAFVIEVVIFAVVLCTHFVR